MNAFSVGAHQDPNSDDYSFTTEAHFNLLSLCILVFVPAACTAIHIVAWLKDQEHRNPLLEHGLPPDGFGADPDRKDKRQRQIYPETAVTQRVSTRTRNTITRSSLIAYLRESHIWLFVLGAPSSQISYHQTRIRRATAASLTIVVALTVSASLTLSGTRTYPHVQSTALHILIVGAVLSCMNISVSIIFRRAQLMPSWQDVVLSLQCRVHIFWSRRRLCSNATVDSPHTALLSPSVAGTPRLSDLRSQDNTSNGPGKTLPASSTISTSVAPQSRVAQQLLSRAEQSMHQNDLSSTVYYLRSAARTDPPAFPPLATDEDVEALAMAYAAQHLGIEMRPRMVPKEVHVRPAENKEGHKYEMGSNGGGGTEEGTATNPVPGMARAIRFFGPMVTVVLTPGTFEGFHIDRGGDPGAEMRLVGHGSATVIRGQGKEKRTTGIRLAEGIGHISVEDLVIAHVETGIDARGNGAGISVKGVVFRDVTQDMVRRPEDPLLHAAGNMTANVERTKLRDRHTSRVRKMRHACQRMLRRGRHYAAHPPWYWLLTVYALLVGNVVWGIWQAKGILFCSMVASVMWLVQAVVGMAVDAVLLQVMIWVIWFGVKKIVRTR
eukprot:gb/GECH01006698.1/.p1 GENE.gb/GECH01006698.1/~~gb/GECH01006698.1/.p1  ORF type:complete len:607 (+),score=74.05 gb/GECH01006698.1/:1-1821(+)